MRHEKPFDSLDDFCARIDPRLVGKRVLESLITAGALDCFGQPREQMMAGIDRIMGLASRARDDAESGQSDIFGTAGAPRQKLILPHAAPWLPAEKLHREFQAVGFYFSAHPLDEYADVLKKMRVQDWAEFSLAVKRGATAGRLAGTVTSKQERKTRTGGKMGIIQLSDSSGQYEAVLFSEALSQYRDLLEPGASVVITVGAEDRPEGVNLRIQTVQSLEAESARTQSAMRVFLRDSTPLKYVSSHLGRRGEGQISFIVILGNGMGEIEVQLPDRYAITPQIASAMRAAPGVIDVELF